MYKLSIIPQEPPSTAIFIKESDDIIPKKTDIKWHKVGEVKKLYTYPIFNGFGVYTPKCNFSNIGMVGKFADDIYRNQYGA